MDKYLATASGFISTRAILLAAKIGGAFTLTVLESGQLRNSSVRPGDDAKALLAHARDEKWIDIPGHGILNPDAFAGAMIVKGGKAIQFYLPLGPSLEDAYIFEGDIADKIIAELKTR